jgi:hypothetical protein
MYGHLYLWTHLRVRYLVGSCIRWFIGTLPDRPIGLYRLKHEVALQRGLAYLSRCNSGWFCHNMIVLLSAIQNVLPHICACVQLLSVKTRWRAATGNTRSQEASGMASGPRSLGQRPSDLARALAESR